MTLARWLPLPVLVVLVVLALGCAGISSLSASAEGDAPGECDDGADNDRDGAFDCNDTECAGAPLCIKAVVATAPATVVAALVAAEPVKFGTSRKVGVPATTPTTPAPVMEAPLDAASPPVARAAPRGGCAGACTHLLGCAGQPEQQAYCVSECGAAGHDATFLDWFLTTDCQTALTVVAMLAGGGDNAGGAQQAQTGGQAARSKDCDGCVWDGSSCTWYSESSWGQGAYSGALIGCASSCCGR